MGDGGTRARRWSVRHVEFIHDPLSSYTLTSIASFRQFASPIHIITCSLGGKVTCLRMNADADHSSRTLDEIWTFDTSNILKVNSMKVSSTSEDRYWIVIGGLDRAGRGIAETHQLPLLPSWCVIQYLRATPSFDGHLPSRCCNSFHLWCLSLCMCLRCVRRSP